ncbi:toxin YdaT family protein [Trabulsiella odontotermitis]|uniref:Uncharacterized protein n=1 Tax=Trabulsiella odontotermitis TaxID=379893 RepID=A0A0L0GYT8_9ENTR|nr:toxin YdaT family protein [Trabulsiella odontotermitis]KNC93638.1 hypothetical protein GM31_18835 [Trabulsiella odontotermitis]
MEFNFNLIKQTLLTFAAEKGQAYAANKIAEEYIALGGTALRLVAGKTWNNEQNIYHRWIHCDTPLKREKIRQLMPAILTALPRNLSARLVLANSMEYRALQLAKEAVNEAADAYVAATVVDVVSQLNSTPDSLALVLH